MIALGKEQPIVNFTVEADPPSVYLVYRLRAEVVDGLLARLGCDPRLDLMKVRCLADDEPDYLVALNYYRVSGLARGLRVEWSLFIEDPESAGVPRYMVFDACSAEFSIDPIDLNTRRTQIEHHRDGSNIVTRIADEGGRGGFECLIEVPPGDGAPLVRTHPEWSIANDFIYWTNGICDRTYYDAGMHHANVRDVPSEFVKITDHTVWASIVEPDPVHVLVFEGRIQLAMSPWENLARLGK